MPSLKFNHGFLFSFFFKIPSKGVIWGFPGSSAGKESACNAGDPGLVPGSGSSPGEAVGYPVQYSWVSLVAQSVKNLPAVQETWVRSLVWRGHGNPLQYSYLENSHGQSSLVGYSPRGYKESDKTLRLSAHARVLTRARTHTTSSLSCPLSTYTACVCTHTHTHTRARTHHILFILSSVQRH